MIKVLDSTKKNFNFYFDSIIKRRKNRTKNISSIVRKIIDDVKKNGDKALLKYEKRYNSNSSIIPNPKKIKKAIAKLDPKVKRAIDVATERIFKWHSLQKVKNINFTDILGNNLKYRYLPIDTACVYVPGSSVSYPSSLLMGAIPAIVAGCKRIILLNPGRNGVHNSAVLYAAHKLKIKVFSCGGSAAIAAAAFGTKKIPKVDLIVGPGSDWVTLAKKEVSDVVGIDGLHGPSEILIVADKYCNLEWIASDLLAQSEHSNDAMSILLSKNKNFIEKVKVSIANQLKNLERKSTIKKSLKTNGMLVYVPSEKKIIEIVNKVGPEHLSISAKNYKKIVAPGVFEIPAIISRNVDKYDGFISLGCVIKGKTQHADLISRASINAIMQLSVQHKKPIGNGIITCLNKKQALERADPTIKNKGGEAVNAILSVLGILKDESK